MGTSTARRSPGAAAWRFAKGAATRYLAPEGGAPVEAREVVRRYLAALEETEVSQGQDLLAGFRLTRKAAQYLGEFGETAAGSGLTTALKAWGSAEAAHSSPEAAILGLTAAWVGEEGGLEAAVTRSALAACLDKVVGSSPDNLVAFDGASLVRTFLAQALFQRLVLDLGESLEAAAPDWTSYRQGLKGLEHQLLNAAAAAPAGMPPAGQWQGLAGWIYVTKIIEHICHNL
ncbi:MAG: hypothetical protein ACUVXF_10570 [Desulfobaccales bacterium]